MAFNTHKRPLCFQIREKKPVANVLLYSSLHANRLANRTSGGYSELLIAQEPLSSGCTVCKTCLSRKLSVRKAKAYGQTQTASLVYTHKHTILFRCRNTFQILQLFEQVRAGLIQNISSVVRGMTLYKPPESSLLFERKGSCQVFFFFGNLTFVKTSSYPWVGPIH